MRRGLEPGSGHRARTWRSSWREAARWADVRRGDPCRDAASRANVRGTDTPTQFGPWHVERRLNHGSVGANFVVRHLGTGERGLLKAFYVEAGSARLQREIQALDQLEDARVPRVLDVTESHLVVQWIDGTNLADVLDERVRIDPDDALAVALAISETLEKAHARGFLHRDIKPSNILVPRSASGDPAFRESYLLDFGLAGLLVHDGHRTGSGSVVGTPSYMSPEQVMGQSAGPPADVWGLGVLLAEMLTGRLPFGGKSIPEVALGILRAPPEFPGDASVDSDVRDVVLRCLEKDPARRFRDGGELRLALEALLSSETATFRPSNAAIDSREPLPTGSFGSFDLAASRPEGRDAPAPSGFGSAPFDPISLPTETTGASIALPPRARPRFLPDTTEWLHLAVIWLATFVLATAVRIRREAAAVDLVLAAAVILLGWGMATSYAGWTMQRRLRPSRPIRALRARADELREAGAVVSESMAIDIADLLQVLEDSGADALHASVAIRLYRQYEQARDSGDDDLALQHVPRLLEHVEARLPLWVRHGAAIDVGIRTLATVTAGGLLLRAAWLASP